MFSLQYHIYNAYYIFLPFAASYIVTCPESGSRWVRIFFLGQIWIIIVDLEFLAGWVARVRSRIGQMVRMSTEFV